MGSGQKQNSSILADRPSGTGWAIAPVPPLDTTPQPFRAASLSNALAQQSGWNYRYAETPPTTTQTADVVEPITVNDLAVMPDDWVAELDRTALLCADRAVQVLIAQIPPSAHKPSRGLTQLNDNYAFAQIQELTRAYLTRQPHT